MEKNGMKILFITTVLIVFTVILTGCLKKKVYLPLETVKLVDLTRYVGRWYEIARYPHRFEEGCSSVSADYTLQENGTIKVLNQCVLEDQGGKVKQAHGTAKVVDSATNAKLKVSFFWPFYGDYWVLHLDPDYQYAIIGAPSRKYLWILARKPHLSPSTLQKLLKKLKGFGYDPDRLIMTDHSVPLT
jgi:apolipoprotein D and lipocalin family protein